MVTKLHQICKLFEKGIDETPDNMSGVFLFEKLKCKSDIIAKNPLISFI